MASVSAFYTVKAEDGEMTTVASLAGSLWQAGVVEGEASHMKKKMIHITSHSNSFKLQQAMVLASVCAESRKQGPTIPQVNVYTWGFWL